MVHAKRRPRSNDYIARTMRYTPTIYDKVCEYAREQQISINMGNEELILKGLAVAKRHKKSTD